MDSTTYDQWDDQLSSSSLSISRNRKPTKAVRDDWEDEDDEDGSHDMPVTEERNQRIWEAANANGSIPMPTLIVSPSSTSSNAARAPPPGAFQPALRILKRPTSSQHYNSQTFADSSAADDLRDREERYHAARERIFNASPRVSGNENASRCEQQLSKAANSSTRVVKSQDDWSSADPRVASISRHPRGPDDLRDGNGFIGARVDFLSGEKASVKDSRT